MLPLSVQLPSSRVRLSSATPLITFVVLGLPAGAIGVAWPSMRSSFGAPLAGLGVVLVATTAGYFLGSAMTGPLAVRTGTKALWIAGCVLEGLSLLGVAAAPQWWLIAGLAAFAGGGSGLIDGAVNTEVSLGRGVRYMGWLHASWAIGAAIAPQVVVVSQLATGSWRPAFVALGAAFLGCAALTALSRPAKGGQALDGSHGSREKRARQYRTAIVVLAALLFLGAGVEASAGDWAYTQLTLGRGVPVSLAGLSASLFWFGLAAGRVGLGLFGDRLSSNQFLDLSVGASFLAAVLFWISPTLVLTAVALALLGTAVSLIFPLLLSMTPARVGRAMTGHSVGFSLAAGTIGGGGIPALVGLVLQSGGLGLLGPALTLVAAGLLGLHLVSRKRSFD